MKKASWRRAGKGVKENTRMSECIQRVWGKSRVRLRDIN